MKDSFIFYKSFYDAINLLGEKAQLKLYKSIMKLNFNWCVNETEMLQLCDEIETDLKQNRHVYGTFLLIKPQILANYSKYLNGCKGAEKGNLGGAPKGNKNASKNNPKTTPNENVLNENVLNENVLNEKLYGEYSNVFLTKEHHGKLLAICASEKLLNELIDSFSVQIEVGKERPYCAELPNAHYERLKSYYNYRKRNPDKFSSETQEKSSLYTYAEN